MNAPALDGARDWKTYKPKSSFTDESGNQGYIGVKTFEYTAVPKAADLPQAPRVAFNYFDPEAGKYVEELLEAGRRQRRPHDTFQDGKGGAGRGRKARSGVLENLRGSPHGKFRGHILVRMVLDFPGGDTRGGGSVCSVQAQGAEA